MWSDTRMWYNALCAIVGSKYAGLCRIGQRIGINLNWPFLDGFSFIAKMCIYFGFALKFFLFFSSLQSLRSFAAHTKNSVSISLWAPPLFNFDIVREKKRTVIDWNIHTQTNYECHQRFPFCVHTCDFQNFRNTIYSTGELPSYSSSISPFFLLVQKDGNISTFHLLTIVMVMPERR